jgi:hypothetical protein
MALPDDYWRSYEARIDSLSEFVRAVELIAAYEADEGRTYVWRGARNASWGLHPSLVRAYIDAHGKAPLERELRNFEASMLEEAREWSLDWHQFGGRLASLELMAALQHYGVPTRMLDFTFSPFVALWFAVDDDDGDEGRVFAIDISRRRVSREDAARADPWWWEVDPGTTTIWATESWIWRPPPFEPRIVRQEGCFLMGGIPSTQPRRNVRENGIGDWRSLRADEVRECMSVPFRLINFQQAVAAASGDRLIGHEPKADAFTLRITNKDVVRTALERAFGYSYRSLFPDFPGFASFGRSFKAGFAGVAAGARKP